MLVGDDLAKDLFCLLLETYCTGDKEEDIELDFSSVLTIDPGFLTAFTLLVLESKQFPKELLLSQVVFSGLFAKDVENLAKALEPLKTEGNVKDLQSSLRKLHEQRQKEIWGNNPAVKEAFDKISGAIEKAFSSVGKV